MKIDDIDKIDTQKIYEIYDKWPEIARESFVKQIKKFDVQDIDHIVFAGMGGSGSIGDVIGAILSKEDVHVSNVKGYVLPKTVDSKTLIVTTSVSGNTRETMTVLEKAKNSPAKIAAFSSGGMIKEYCQRNNIFHQEISMIHSPRASFTNFLYGIINTLEAILPIKRSDVLESISILDITKKNISSENLTESNDSLKLAQFVKEIPCLYYPAGLQSAAIRFKNSLQENAKMHVIAEDVIESCHNGIVAWKKNSDVYPILIKGQDDYIKTKERWSILEEFFDKKGIKYFSINSVNGNILSKIMNLVYIFDYATVYFSILNSIDPSPVDAIDYIKSRL
tara:strand:- start:216 stop:1223 length:1008 start_codon:yes stop_codon:yes gene_type:complete